jgi:hypothetical protein
MLRSLALLGAALAVGCSSPAHQEQGLCQSDADCVAPTAVCDVATGVCGVCSPAADACPTGSYCAAVSLTCQPGCRSDADCTTPAGDTPALTCDSSHACVGCHGDDARCPAGTVCSGERCVAGCTAAHACPAPAVCCGGACLDVSADVDHCGGCAACPPWPGAVVECAAGACRVASCQPDFADCNGLADDGCEVDLRTSPDHCGACGTKCSVARGAARCVAKQCEVASCDTGWGDCDSLATNGCETDLTSSTEVCGQCGVAACTAPPHVVPACVLASCGYAGCAAGYADCNHDLPTDGCEINLLGDVNNCGACGYVCPALPHATVGCQQGACVIAACDPGYGDCDGYVLDGCESDLSSDPAHCSACGHACAPEANGTVACVSSQCGVGGCDNGFADCDGDPGNGCETNLANDFNNCGACGVPCAAVANGTPICSGFICGVGSCDSGYADCFGGAANGCETNLLSDVNHCNTCGTVCPVVANGTRACVSGGCAVGSCAAGYADCDGNLDTGCEINLATDVNNCNGCDQVCTPPTNGVAGCVAGACTLAGCDPGFSDCDHDPNNGCEKNTSSDPQNCGGCGVVCGSGQCANSACTGCVKKVLLIADDSAPGAATLRTALTTAGYTVTQTTVPSYQYDGTNPPTAGFGTIIVLAGGPSTTSYTVDMPSIPSAATPSCRNGVMDGLETDVDCGGSGCPGCAIGKVCKVNLDCQSGNCSAGHCVASPATCSNGVKDGSETDIDCGGGAGCPPCGPGKSCSILAGVQPNTNDCRSGFCNSSNKCGGDGQQAIVDFLAAGNGVVFSEWAAYQVAAGRWTKLAPNVLLQRTKSYSGQVTYTVDPAFASGPLWSGLPASFTFASVSNVGLTRVAAGVTRVASSPQAIDGVAIRDTGVGRVVHVSHAGDYSPNGWTNANMQQLIVNAVGWTARCF